MTKVLVTHIDEIDIDGEKCGKDCQYVEEASSFARDNNRRTYYWWTCKNPIWGQDLKYWTVYGDENPGCKCLTGGLYAYRCKECLSAKEEGE